MPRVFDSIWDQQLQAFELAVLESLKNRPHTNYPTHTTKDAYTVTLHFDNASPVRLTWEEARRAIELLIKGSPIP